jgi:hypothetical protein
MEDLTVNWRILAYILTETGWKDVVGNNLAQDRDKWQAVLNTVKNLGVL